jgi:hypothetical protein
MEELRKAEQTQHSFMPVLTAKRKPTEKPAHQHQPEPHGTPSEDGTDSGPKVHERLYSDATKWRERHAHKAQLQLASPDPNCTFAPTVELSAKSLKTNAQSSSVPVAETRPRYEVLYEDSKVRERARGTLASRTRKAENPPGLLRRPPSRDFSLRSLRGRVCALAFS